MHEAVVREQRQRMQSGQQRDKSFEGKGGAEVLH